MYKVKDFNNELIEGDFYENDLQIVKKRCGFFVDSGKSNKKEEKGKQD